MVSILIPQRSAPRRTRAFAATCTAILAVLTVVALIGSPDGETAIKLSTSVDMVATMAARAKTQLTTLEATKANDRVAQSASKLEGSVDNKDEWAKLHSAVSKAAEGAKNLTQSVDEEDSKIAEDKVVEAKQEELAKEAEHVEHQQARANATSAATNAVSKGIGDLIDGMTSTAQKDAEKAAHDVIQTRKKKDAEEKAREDKAIARESIIQAALDEIKESNKELADIRQRTKQNNEMAKKRAKAFTKQVREHVQLAMEKFKSMHADLEQLRGTAHVLADEKEKLKGMKDKAAALRTQLTAISAKNDFQAKNNAKENSKKKLEKAEFKQKKTTIVTKMSSLVKKMKHAIKFTAVKKATPHQDAQNTLNSLNAKTQHYASEISTLSAQITCLQKELKVAQEQEAAEAKKKANRKKLLMIADQTYKQLHATVEQLQGTVTNKDKTMQIQKAKSEGVDFAKTLANRAERAVESAAEQAVQSNLHKLDERIANKTTKMMMLDTPVEQDN